MNQPAQALNIEALSEIERATFDAFSSISAALAHNLILGFGGQSVKLSEVTPATPGVSLIFHPEKDGEQPRHLVMVVPQDGANFFHLLVKAGNICAKVLNEFQQSTHEASQHFAARVEVAKVRRNAKSRIIRPGAN